MPQSRDPNFPNPDDTVRVPGEELVGVVVNIGIGLNDDGSGTEIITAKFGEDQIKNIFASVCEVVTRADADRVTGGEDGGTLKSAATSDTTITRGGETVATDVGDELTDSELERLTDPANPDSL